MFAGGSVLHLLRDVPLDGCYIRAVCQQDLPSTLVKLNITYGHRIPIDLTQTGSFQGNSQLSNTLNQDIPASLKFVPEVFRTSRVDHFVCISRNKELYETVYSLPPRYDLIMPQPRLN